MILISAKLVLLHCSGGTPAFLKVPGSFVKATEGNADDTSDGCEAHAYARDDARKCCGVGYLNADEHLYLHGWNREWRRLGRISGDFFCFGKADFQYTLGDLCLQIVGRCPAHTCSTTQKSYMKGLPAFVEPLQLEQAALLSTILAVVREHGGHVALMRSGYLSPWLAMPFRNVSLLFRLL